jgi:hypothetical protein
VNNRLSARLGEPTYTVAVVKSEAVKLLQQLFLNCLVEEYAWGCTENNRLGNTNFPNNSHYINIYHSVQHYIFVWKSRNSCLLFVASLSVFLIQIFLITYIVSNHRYSSKPMLFSLIYFSSSQLIFPQLNICQ